MGIRRHRSHTRAAGRTAGSDPEPRGTRRGWGPFSGGQLTVVIVAVALVCAPTAALAAIGTFTSNSAVPAVKGTNSSAVGTGVQGTGKKFGVFSNGPLGVAAGKKLVCTGCVPAGALANLRSGQSESGTFSAGGGTDTGGYIGQGVTYVRPLSSAILDGHIVDVATGTWPAANCPGPGKAAVGYLCLYEMQTNNVGTGYGYSSTLGTTPSFGSVLFWPVVGGGLPYAGGVYTVTAP